MSAAFDIPIWRAKADLIWRWGPYSGTAEEVIRKPVKSSQNDIRKVLKRFINKRMSEQERNFYEFGEFRIDLTKRRLLRAGEIVPLAPKVFDLLLTLAERSGKTIEKDELMQKIWPDAVVEENNL